jgi:hypothetical protein
MARLIPKGSMTATDCYRNAQSMLTQQIIMAKGYAASPSMAALWIRALRPS